MPTLGDLRRSSSPTVLRGRGSDAAKATWGAFNSEETRARTTTFRMHPFPEDGVNRRSVREAECYYLTATVGDFLEWESLEAGTSPLSGPFAPFERGSFWAYSDYKDACEFFKDGQCHTARGAELSEADGGHGDGECALRWDDFAPGCSAEGKVGLAEATVWLGSRGAHSALHFDTYGCNVILQVFIVPT